MTDQALELLSFQKAYSDADSFPSVFLRGAASTGKTTAGLCRLNGILARSSPGIGESVLVLVPQRSLGFPYQEFIQRKRSLSTDQVSIQTMSSIIRRTVDLFWPIFSDVGLFRHPFEKPRFLTLETSQYTMAQIVNPMIDQGRFSTVSLPLYRLCSQLIDNLNKSALVGFPHTEIGTRLSSAWIGDAPRQRVFEDVQEAVNKFRDICLSHNLVDFSLQVELFTKYLWQNQSFQKYIRNLYQHLIYDNCEEDPPFVHKCILDWLPSFKSSLVIFDEKGGFRSFLGADPDSALRLASICEKTVETHENLINTSGMVDLSNCLANLSGCLPNPELIGSTVVFPKERIRFFPDMLSNLTENLALLIENEQVDPSEIAIISPFISDSLQFSLQQKLLEHAIPLAVQKPSMPLAQNATVRTLIALAKFAHPGWQLETDFHLAASTLNYAVRDLDLVRAHLLLGGLKPDQLSLKLLPNFVGLEDRVPEDLIKKYDRLREWLASIDEQEPLDHFFSRLFGEVLSQPGFGFHEDTQAGVTTAMLMESYRKFSLAFRSDSPSHHSNFGCAFIASLDEGLIPAMYLAEWEKQDSDAILFAPVTSFLMRNQPIRFQFWLNIGSKGWYERLEQPLTHPIVLSRQWTRGRQWTADEELAYNNRNMEKVVQGLLARCRERIFLYTSDTNEAGVEERGQMLTLWQNFLRKAKGGTGDT